MVCAVHVKITGNCLSTDLIGLLCDVVQSVVCELFVNQEHVIFTSLVKSFLLLTKAHKKVSLKGRTS